MNPLPLDPTPNVRSSSHATADCTSADPVAVQQRSARGNGSDGPQSCRHPFWRFINRRAGLMLALMLASGLFIWAKLRLVTAVPRTAFAEPASEPLDGAPQPKTRHAERRSDDTTPATRSVHAAAPQSE